MLEIGAGAGALTAALARRCDDVVAVELDPGLCGRLEQRFGRATGVRVVRADFLTWPLPRSADGAYKVVANPPFHITAAIVRRLARAKHAPEDALLVMQHQAALRFAGGPYAGESLLSLQLKPWWQIEIRDRLARAAFRPAPPVDCVALNLARRPRPLVKADERQLYLDFLAAGFGRRGRSLRDGLRPLLSPRQLSRLSRELRFDLAAPPAALGFDQWLQLFRCFARRSDRRGAVRGASRRALSRGR